MKILPAIGLWSKRLSVGICLLSSVASCSPTPGHQPPKSQPAAPAAWRQACTLPDISGLAWIDGDRFLAVHDAKAPEENDIPRVSLLRLPDSLTGIHYRPLALSHPAGPSNDFESIARIPGTDDYLLIESTEQQSTMPHTRRLFLTRFANDSWQQVDVLDWPTPSHIVEGAAVAKLDDRFVFVYAERSDGRGSTPLRWAPFDPRAKTFGTFRTVSFTCPFPTGPHARPVSGIDIDRAGYVYVGSAEDPGDNGPFTSAVYRIGRVTLVEGRPQIVLREVPQRLGTLDGMKVESVSIRELPGRGAEVFVGTDDENYGGTVRPLMPTLAQGT